MKLTARWSPPAGPEPAPLPEPADGAAGAALAAGFLARHNLASNEDLARTYDHEVKALSAVKPWVGVHRDVPSDASVMFVDYDGATGYALAEGIFPRYSDVDARAMAEAGVDLAVRRVIAAGADPERIAALDNFCWPDPLPGPSNPDAEHKLAQLVRACRGLHDICVAYGVPLISGKDSMKNDAVVGGRRISIPPSLLVSAIGIVPDARRATTLEARPQDQVLVLVGETRDELGGSEWAAARGVTSCRVPVFRPEAWAARYRRVADAIARGLAGAAHAPGPGGLLPALFRMARAADAGLSVDLGQLPVEPAAAVGASAGAGAAAAASATPGWEARLFAESGGRFLLACAPERLGELLAALGDEPAAPIGLFRPERQLTLTLAGRALVDAPLAQLTAAWKRAGEVRA
jgi:phosphoribosylformylglycinamidine synthase